MKKRIFAETFTVFYKYVVSLFFTAILLLLIFFCAVSTCYINITEKTYYVKDNVFLNLLAVFAVILMFLVCKNFSPVKSRLEKINNNEECFRKYKKILFIILFGIAAFWVLATQYCPGADQFRVQEAVEAFHNKDYTLLSDTGYLSRHKHQLGLVWMSYLVSLLFGSYNWVVLQLLNVAGLILFYYELVEICGQFRMKNTLRLLVLLCGILFFPMIMYCSFVYGTILGLAFSALALHQELLFFNTLKKRHAFYSAMSITLALFFKRNYLVFMIGFFIIALIEGFKEKKIWFLLLPLFSAALIVQSVIPVMIARKVSGESLEQGESSWSYIAMGLQESELAPGWYNGYNDSSYTDSNYITDVQTETVKENIRESVQKFLSNKKYAVTFFSRKIASQWCNPNFQSFWIVQIRSSQIQLNDWVYQFTSMKGTDKCAKFLNLFQFVILVGSLF